MKKLIVVAALVCAGCATNQPQSTAPTYTGCVTWEAQRSQAAFSAVSVLSPELARMVGVRGIGIGRSGTGLANIRATVYNCSDVDVVVLMRSRFSGNAGQSEPPSAWKMVHLAPRAQFDYGESAISEITHGIAIDIYDANRGQSQFAPGQTYKPND